MNYNKDNLILDVQNITKTFQIHDKNGKIGQSTTEFKALHCINFQLMGGEVLGIIGSNGAGKSTLLKILAEVIPPSSGTVHVYGTILSILEVGTGFHPDLSGIENIYLNAALLGMKKKQVRQKIEEIVEFSGISEFINEPIKNYSSGMYLRLALSIALFMECDLLLLDEVIAVGDANFRKKALEKIKEKINQGMSCILISHDMNTIVSLCNSCLWLEGGKIYKSGTAGNIVSEYYNAIEATNKKIIRGHSEKINLISVHSTSSQIFTDESFSIIIKYQVKEPGNFAILLRTFFHQQALLTDSLVFRGADEPRLQLHGDYELVISFPPHLFNAGHFWFDFLIGTTDEIYYEIEKAITLKVLHRDWEANKNWNSSDKIFPIRPQLQWNYLKK